MHSQDGTSAFNRSLFEFGSENHQRRKDNILPDADSANVSKQKSTRFASRDRQV
jgi:hypothetical protein